MVVVAIIMSSVSINVARAASLTVQSDVMSNQTLSQASNHVITFTTPTGAADNTDTIIVTFPSDFDFTNAAFGDVTLTHGATTGLESTETVATAASASDWGAAFSGTQNRVLTLTAPTDGVGSAAIAASDKVIITLANTFNGTCVANSSTVTSCEFINASTAGSKTVAITGAFGDTGSYAVAIIDNDDVTITATVDPSITFDLDTGTAQNANTGSPYSIALGTLDTNGAGSDQSTIASIFIDLDTNATGGASVKVSSANSGLLSGSDLIASADGDLNGAVSGNGNYGVCVESVAATTGTLARGTPFSTTACDVADGQTFSTGGNTVEAVAASAEILNTSTDPIAGGRAEILVKAKITAVTPAGSYSDTLTFTAVGTF